MVADLSGEPAGFCQLYPTFCSLEAAKIYTLNDLYVEPRHRGKGAGEALLLAAEQRARDDGAVRLELTARTNSAAQRLYEKTVWLKDEIYLAYSRAVT